MRAMNTLDTMRFEIPAECTASATFAQLREGELAAVPSDPGIYMVLTPPGPSAFEEESCGGHFKDRDPSVSVSLLETKWVETAPVLYIGKANNLRRRLREYCVFGEGRRIGHWGGRFVWQLRGCQTLVVTWMPTPGEDPRKVEQEMISRFEATFGRLPFANLSK
jgi:hypothetical protein